MCFCAISVQLKPCTNSNDLPCLEGPTEAGPVHWAGVTGEAGTLGFCLTRPAFSFPSARQLA